jgi:3-oxoacyl-[acyl-carrier protein] reductase
MQTMLITGAANGIGRALTEHFLQKGWHVFATDSDPSPLLSIHSPNITVVKLDVRKVEEWTEVLQDINQLDVVINNAGVIVPSFVNEIQLQDIDYQVDINLKGVINGSTLAAQKMILQGFGHIINIASLAGLAPVHGLSIYAATKAAVRSFSLSIAFELGKKNIFISVIYPDLVNTNMLTKQLDYEAAAMTFSGSKVLETKDIVVAIEKEALKHKNLEILLPRSRGWLAKIGNLWPSKSTNIVNSLLQKGQRNLTRIKEQRR